MMVGGGWNKDQHYLDVELDNTDQIFDLNVYLEPIELTEDGNYNFNVVSDIDYTEHFMSLDESTRGCQNLETLDSCTTRVWRENILKKCNCYPWKLGIGKGF